MGEGGGKVFGFQSSSILRPRLWAGKDQNGFALFVTCPGWMGSLDASLSCLFLPQTNTLMPTLSGEAGEGRQELTKKNETLDSLDPSP